MALMGSSDGTIPGFGTQQVGFTGGQRFGTWALNGVFGLGSFVIMRDWLGGGIIAGASLLSLILLVDGLIIGVETEETYSSYYGDTTITYWDFNYTSIVLGVVLMVGHSVFNIIRSVTYQGRPQVAAMFDTWNIAFAPNDNGTGQVSLSYRMRF
jgi:hypothetical protein